ncbi:WD repeat-containing protein 82 [Drosophila virilis]|uniref:WD repeat-containing protein 55 homolog n=1 Tax=Drosophila virilis TaxID=7244 RepID=B4LUE7_DROVI|nr:WD repeat-containing protein 82 [Drosophila virilis]EDW64133.2 uncharacterized protein Dvir_GJ24160 [Drosophila virilis]
MNKDTRMKLAAEALREFRVAKSFQPTSDIKYSMCFSQNGEHLVSCDHHNLILFNCNKLTQLCMVHMRQFRPELVSFTTQNDRLLHSSTKVDCAIRYLDLSSHQHLGLFSGHTSALRALCLQPGSEHQFMSSGCDDRVFVWDLRTCGYTHQLKHLHRPLLAYDPTGRAFATCHNTERIEIHDVRMLSAKPCQQFGYQLNELAKWTQLQFAPDGKTLLVNTDNAWCFSVDAYRGSFRQAYTGYANRQQLPLQVCYTPDSQYVLAGADNGRIHVWEAVSGDPLVVLRSKSHYPMQCIQFNPRRSMFASGDVRTLLWLTQRKHELKPTAIIDLTATDDSEVELGEIKTASKRQRQRRAWPMPMELPRWPPPSPPPRVLRWRRRRLRQVEDADSLEEGELR